MKIKLSRLGPGLLFAGAAIESLIWFSLQGWSRFWLGTSLGLLLINLFKYPFQWPKICPATGETLLDGTTNLKRIFMGIFF